MKCANCDGELKYVADLSAPGYGQSWRCVDCSESHWVVGGRATKFEDIDPTVFNDYF